MTKDDQGIWSETVGPLAPASRCLTADVHSEGLAVLDGVICHYYAVRGGAKMPGLHLNEDAVEHYRVRGVRGALR